MCEWPQPPAVDSEFLLSLWSCKAWLDAALDVEHWNPQEQIVPVVVIATRINFQYVAQHPCKMDFPWAFGVGCRGSAWRLCVGRRIAQSSLKEMVSGNTDWLLIWSGTFKLALFLTFVGFLSFSMWTMTQCCIVCVACGSVSLVVSLRFCFPLLHFVHH